MEKQYSLDLSVPNPEKTSTYLAGQYLMSGIPNLNVIYEDDLCTCYIHDVYGNGELLVFHADVVKTTDRKVLAHYHEVMANIFDALREKGLTEIEAWVVTDQEIKYAQYMGFDQFLGELVVEGRPTTPTVYRLKKEL